MPLEVSDEDPSEIFQILQKLGEGSYGSVFKAIDGRDQQTVAIKVLESEDDEDTSELQKEINILKECNSDYIVSYKGTFQKDGNIWIVMEYCGAGSLCDLMAICERVLDEDQIAAVMKMSLHGLAYLHKMKKIHRDIKSGNILLNHEGDCKLADFGVSAELTTTLAKRKTMIGTPYWMAPEVLQSAEYDGKADIWSLAITAIELAASEPPHSSVHPMRAIFLIPNSDPPTVPNPENYSADFIDFLKVCLVKDHTKRPSASELLSHSFIKNAKGKKIISSLVSECMEQIDAYREQEEAEGDEEEEEEEDGDYDASTMQQYDTMVTSGTSGTMVNMGTMVQNGTMVNMGTMIQNDMGTMVQSSNPRSRTDSNYRAAREANARAHGLSVEESKERHMGTLRHLDRKKSLKAGMSQMEISGPTTAPDVPDELQYFAKKKDVDLSPGVSLLDLRCQLADVNKAYSMERAAFEAYYNSKRKMLQLCISEREAKKAAGK